MATITEIKSKIDLLDQAKFQELCDAIIKLENHRGSIISYGLNSRGRTIKGTPDSFILVNGTTIFVECSIQQSGLFKKFESDISKCLSISSESLRKIILAYTGRLSVVDIEKLLKLLPNEIELDMYSIDELAYLIYIKYQFLAKDYLDLSVDSGQIVPLDFFIDTMDKNVYSSPLNVDFMFREECLNEVKSAIKDFDYVVLTGSPGCGKTRLALEVLKQEENRTCYVIKNMSLPIHDDLNRYFQNGRKYLVLIDDANQLNQLSSLILLFSAKYNPSDIKIILTVRDYAKSIVLSQLSIVSAKEVKVTLFTDMEILNIIKNNLKILNQDYLDQIVKVSKGNPRIAYLIGLTAIRENKLASIHNNEETMSFYYRNVIEIVSIEKNSLICFGVMSFLNKLKLNSPAELEKISHVIKISVDDFLESINFLHRNELIDVYNDNVAMISDETLGNYIFYYVFIKIKMIDIAEFIKTYFKSHIKRVIYVINSTLSIFYEGSKDVFQESTLKIFNELKNISKVDTLEYLVHFSPLFELESINYLNDVVESYQQAQVVDQIQCIKDYDKERIKSPILETLYILSEGNYYLEVFEILIQLLHKEGFKTNEVVATIFQSFKIRKSFIKDKFRVQNKILEIIASETSEDIKRLGIILVNNYVSLGFEETRFKDNKNLEIYRFIYNEETYCLDFRKKIWTYVSDNFSQSEVINCIKIFLESNWVYNVEKDIIESELNLIITNLIDIISESPLLILKLSDVAKFHEISNEVLVKHQTLNIVYICKTLYQKHFDVRNYPEDYKERSNELLIKFSQDLNDIDFQLLIDFLSKNLEENYVINESINIILLNLDNQYFFKLLEYFFTSDSKVMFYPGDIINKIKSYGFDFLKYINQFNKFAYRDNWILHYYETLTKTEINDNITKDFLSFLDEYSVFGKYRYARVEDMEKYLAVDNLFFEKYAEISLKKDINTFSSLTKLLFNEYTINPSTLYSFLNHNVDLYKKLYFKSFEIDHNFDYNSRYIGHMCSVNSSSIFEYVALISSHNDIHLREHSLSFIWEMSNSKEIVNEVLDMLINKHKSNSYSYIVNNPLVLLKTQNNLKEYFEILRNRILTTSDSEEISIISDMGLYLEDYRIELFKSFIVNCKDFELFKSYKILPSHSSWSGSAIPQINSDISMIERFIAEVPEGIHYLRQKRHLQQYIDSKLEERKYWEEKELFDEL